MSSSGGSFGDPTTFGVGYSAQIAATGNTSSVTNSMGVDVRANVGSQTVSLLHFSLAGQGGAAPKGNADLVVMGATLLSEVAPVNKTWSKSFNFWKPKFQYTVTWIIPITFSAEFSIDGAVGISLNETATATSAKGDVTPTVGASVSTRGAVCFGDCTFFGIGLGLNGFLRLIDLSLPLRSSATLTGPSAAVSDVSLNVGLSALSGRIGYSLLACFIGICATPLSGDLFSWPGYTNSWVVAGAGPRNHCL